MKWEFQGKKGENMENEGMNPGRLMGIASAYWQSFTLHAGVKLDVFSIIGDKKISGEDVAKALKGDFRGVTTLLNALTAMNMLEKSEGLFSNIPLGRTFLCKDSERYMGYIINHMRHLVNSWSRLDEAVKTGGPVREATLLRNDEEREAFLMGMYNVAMGSAPAISAEVDLKGRKHILDMGGGPGTWAIHFCLANPELKGTIFDLPETRPFAEKTIERYGLNDRIDFQSGSFIDDDINGSYDVAWLSQILHAVGPDTCEKIIEKAVSVLEPGGMVMVHEFLLDNNMSGPLQPALFSLNMLLGTPNGRSYSEAQIMEMLVKAGAKDIKRLDYSAASESGIIADRRTWPQFGPQSVYQPLGEYRDAVYRLCACRVIVQHYDLAAAGRDLLLNFRQYIFWPFVWETG